VSLDDLIRVEQLGNVGPVMAFVMGIMDTLAKREECCVKISVWSEQTLMWLYSAFPFR